MKKGITYKHSGIPWLGDVPAHWEVVKVKHRYHFQTGFTPETKNDTYYDDDGHNWVTIADINANKSGYIAESSTRISQAFVDKFSPKIVPAESLLYSFKLSVGKTAIAKTDLYTNEAIAAFPPDNPCVSFLKYSCSQLINAANENIYGAKILNSSLISNAQIVFPPLTEQRAIATFLDEKTAQLDSAIESVEKSVELLRELRAATISEAVTRGLNAHAPLRDSGVPWIGKVPEHWGMRKLKQIAKLKTGHTPPSTQREYFDGLINWYTPADIVDNVLEGSSRTLTTKAVEDSEVSLVPEKSTFLVAIGSVGKVGFSDKPACSNQQITALTPIKDVDAKWLFYALMNQQNNLSNLAMFTILPILNNNYLGNYQIPLPPLEEQQEIARYLDEKTAQIDALVSAKQRQVQLLRELRASVIAEAMTGKLGIRE